MEFEKVCSALYQDMFNHAMRLTYHNRARAQDIVQDSMIRAMNAWGTFVPGENFMASARSWMYRIVTNAFINEYQARKRWNRCLHDDARCIVAGMFQNAEIVQRTDQSETQEANMHAAVPPEVLVDAEREMSEQVAKAIDELEDWQRDFIVLYYITGLSYKEIAEVRKVPMGTVMSRLARAREALEGKLRVFARDELGYKIKSVGAVTSDIVDTGQKPARRKAAKVPKSKADSVQGIMRHDDASTLSVG